MQYLITGANRGIGLEFVKQLAERGASILATARNPSTAMDLQEVAESSDGDVRVIQLDVTNPESVTKLGAFLESESVDVLINNAGRLSRGGGPGAFDFEQMYADFNTNTIGTLRVTEAALAALRRGEAKKIMNISSKMGSIADNGSGGAYAYRMSKSALNMATRSLAADLKPEGFSVITVHPGWVQTDMGGPNALIDAPTSVSGLLTLLDRLSPTESGRFWEWKGTEIPW